MRIVGWAMAATLACAWPSLVAAQTRVAIGDFKGTSAKQVHDAVEGVLEDHDMEVVPSAKVKTTAKRTGAELDSEAGRVRVAKKLRLRAFIEGKIKTVKKKIQVTIVVYNGGDGMKATEFTASAPKAGLVKEIQSKLWPAIGAALSGTGAAPVEAEPAVASGSWPDQPSAPSAPPARAAATPTRKPTPSRPVQAPPPPPPPPQEQGVTQGEDEEAPPGVVAQADSDMAEQADQEEPSGVHPTPVDLGVAARFGTRDFAYNDSLPGLRGYSLGLSPSISLRARWYPAAHFSSGVLAHIGLDLRGDLMVGVSSKNSAGQKFSTSSHAFGVGLRGRIPLNKLELGGVIGFGQHSFGLSNEKNLDPDVPDVVYNFLRIGPDLRWNFVGPFTLQVGAAFLVGLSNGEISDKAWFPHASGNGLEAEVGVALALSRVLSLEATFGLQRYFMSLNPDPKDPGVVGTKRVAGGALDEYFSTRMGVILRP